MPVRLRGVWIVPPVLLASLLVACSRGPAAVADASASGLPWEHSLPSALSRAASEKKLVMVDFYTDWCRWCKELDRNTLADRRVQGALTQVVPVRLNAETDGRDAADRYGVDGYPTVIFLNPGGQEIGRIPGYLGPGQFLQEVQDILHKA